jgi:hypothetical protein
MNLCVNTIFASVPIIYTYTETAEEEMTVNIQMGRRGEVEIFV